MAPQLQQQNSTFIDDNLDSCPSLLNLPESPILPPRRCRNQDTNNNKQAAWESMEVPPMAPQPLLVPPPPPPPSSAAPAPVQEQAICKNKHGKANGNGGQAASRRHRSISLYGVNSTVEQGHKEIPIWMDDGEPRFVSGVTNKTTCNDIIKALIDDELNGNGDGNYCGNNNTNSNPKDGVERRNTATASRDYGDYIITESWGGIERSYDGNMAILPVWRAWSRVHNELRLSLKRRDDFRDPLQMQLIPHGPPPTTSSASFSMLKWLKKLLNPKKCKKNMPKPANTPPKVPNKAKEKCLLSKRQTMPNELVLVIMPDQLYNGKENPTKGKLYKLAENRVSKPKRRRRSYQEKFASSMETFKTAIPSECNNNNNINNNYIRRRKDKPLRNSVRNKLASLHADMNVRYEREYALTRQLSEKCRLYRLQNERYKGPEMEVSVGQLQLNIEAHAEDIIKTEHELLELKNEIKHDISLINNLKRLTIEETEAEAGGGVANGKTKTNPSEVAKNPQEMQFVDNIYEFCDNNASMLV